jgi:regulator of replication initiation timing
MLNQKKFKEHDAWLAVHNQDQRAFLESMTIVELQERANKLGINDDYISEYGHMQYKSTYISALRMAHVLTQKAVAEKATETGLFDDEAFEKLEMDFLHTKDKVGKLVTETDKLMSENIAYLETIDKLRHQLNEKDKDLFQVRSLAKKRKRERDDSIQDKQRTLFEIKQMYKRLKGEKAWTYDTPEQMTGPSVTLWKRYKCKRVIGCNEFGSDLLRPRGPSWQSIDEVESALSDTLQ